MGLVEEVVALGEVDDALVRELLVETSKPLGVHRLPGGGVEVDGIGRGPGLEAAGPGAP